MIGKLSFVLLFAFAACSDEIPYRVALVDDNGKAIIKDVLPDPVTGRIVGGTYARDNQFPHQAALTFSGVFSWRCGGSIISDTYIMSAGHCTDNADTVEIILGVNDAQNPAEDGYLEVTATNIMTHPDYSSTTLHNDIGLIQLDSPLAFHEGLCPAQLPPTGYVDPAPGEIIFPSGHGLDSDPGQTSEDLKFVNASVISVAECQDTYAVAAYEGVICTGGDNGFGICSGDSGGPANESPGGYNNIVVGVVSFGHVDGCDSGNPQGYARVTYHMDWITANSGVTGGLTYTCA